MEEKESMGKRCVRSVDVRWKIRRNVLGNLLTVLFVTRRVSGRVRQYLSKHDEGYEEHRGERVRALHGPVHDGRPAVSSNHREYLLIGDTPKGISIVFEECKKVTRSFL